MRLRLVYCWPMESPEMDFSHLLCATKSIGTTHSSVCPSFFMTSSPSKTSSIMTRGDRHHCDHIQPLYIRPLSLFLEVAEMSETWWGNDLLCPQPLLEANGSPRSIFWSQFLHIWLDSIFGWNLTTFIMLLPFIKQYYFLLASVLPSPSPFLFFISRTKLSDMSAWSYFIFHSTVPMTITIKEKRKGTCCRCQVRAMCNEEITRSVPRSPCENDQHFGGRKEYVCWDPPFPHYHHLGPGT